MELPPARGIKGSSSFCIAWIANQMLHIKMVTLFSGKIKTNELGAKEVKVKLYISMCVSLQNDLKGRN